MNTRRDFLKTTGGIALSTWLLPDFARAAKVKDVGIQLYTMRDAMLEDAAGTLKKLAKIGYKELESARSDKGNYYGLTPQEVKSITKDLGLTMRSGHVHVDDDWQRSVDMAAEIGQEYLVCSSLPLEGQTVDNYKKVADIFSKAAEESQKAGVTFGYHNHDYEFEKDNGQVLYDVLLDNTDPKLVKMEMDLGWVIVTGNDPLAYFDKYPGRFPLWHLKDMKKGEPVSTEFGKGQISVQKMLDNARKAGMKYFFVEQEEYTDSPLASARYNYDYLMNL